LSKKNSLTPEFIELTIDSLSYNGGRGVGRVDGMVVFIPGTAPGDHVRARVTERKPRFLEAECIEILEPGRSRRTPPCPVAGRCGGCSWQHVSYLEQIQQKQKILRDSLRALAPVEWLEFAAAPDEFHYRNRIQLQIQNGQRGFFAKRSRDLVSFDRCWIADSRLNERLHSLTDEECAGARRVELAVDERDGRVHVMAGERDPEAALFSQVNTAQNEKLKELLLAATAIEPKWIMDLYSGAGNLAAPLRQRFPSTPFLAVEFSRSSVERGRERLPDVEWISGDVGGVLRQQARRSGAGLMVCDPPRTGLDTSAVREILRHAPAQILYVSCNPTTFARDVLRLQPAFRLEHVRGLDMFPQTEHVELIASLRAATSAASV
jgi:23S rRNA (uracil1939-C5)-methyltransferase